MPYQFTVHLNVNKIITDDINTGRSVHYIELIDNGISLGKASGSHTFVVNGGAHNFVLKYNHMNDTSQFIHSSAVISCNIDNDFEATINVYFINSQSVEYFIGYEPFDPEKAKAKGCYVATCVYGSYDCPQVWTLRRYRDNTLGSTWYGRAFIKLYYSISPTLVKWFGNTNWFKNMWKPTLDKMVAKLNRKGVESTPYNDKNW